MQSIPQQTMIRAMRDQANFESAIAAAKRAQEKQEAEKQSNLSWFVLIIALLAIFYRRRSKVARNPGA
jgi:hypothetical protein